MSAARDRARLGELRAELGDGLATDPGYDQDACLLTAAGLRPAG